MTTVGTGTMTVVTATAGMTIMTMAAAEEGATTATKL
jgi:hypothetical protein